MKLMIVLFSALLLEASILDFATLNEAKKAYEKKEYAKAAKSYEKVAKRGNDEALFNLGDSYYRQEKYKEAMESFSQITDPALQYKKLHNMGNCYANLGKIDEGIKAYEEALNLQKDPDTEYNLELLKQKQNKDKQNKDKQNKDKQNKQNEKNGQDRKDQKKNSERNSDNKKSEQDQKNNKEKQKENQAKSTEEKKSQDNQKREEEERTAMEQAQMKKAPISDMEERKYKKMLQGRGVNTLMLPIETKGEKENETKPW